MKRVLKKYRWHLISLLGAACICYYFCLPDKLFNDPYSTVLQASNGELLSASIARDGQWRFPQTDSIPEKFAIALVAFEDKRFWKHPGVDPFSLGRALKQNILKRRVVSGGSTISMQVIRLSRRDQPRTLWEKTIEIVLATRLEWRYSKNEILSLYASHAPFGGNVVGVEAACWRYFGSGTKNLSWAEAAMLAVLPNSPSLIHPGRNRSLLLAKRNRLLDKLKAIGVIDDFTCSLSKDEPIPQEPHSLPRSARHLLTRLSKDGLGEQKVMSTIAHQLQRQTELVLQQHQERLSANRIGNAAALILDVETGNVLAYAGNINSDASGSGADVDIITSARSTGSILKPILYAAMLDEGKLLPHTLLPDYPVMINGFSPKNFSHEHDGAVQADQALIRSLNIPAVHMLKEFRQEKFYNLLRSIGITSFTQSPDHYGLSLILGGGEGTLWDITGAYASMARTLNSYFDHPGKNRYDRAQFHKPYYTTREASAPQKLEQSSWINAAAIYLTFEALREVYRPGEETGWKYFSSSKHIAWKTGTSFGLRDGWAIGVTPDYAVGVWVGNADGEGRPRLTGTDAAAPVMFDIFSKLPSRAWFSQPLPEMQKIATCKKSGHRASERCTEKDTIWVTRKGLETQACPYHRVIHLSADLKYRLHSECASLNTIVHRNWFVLPPVQEFYFKLKNSSYKTLPPFRHDCLPTSAVAGMDMIYPKPNAQIFIPRDIDGRPGSSVFELAHRDPNAFVFWHLDGLYIGSTKKIHHLPLNPGEGKHTLTIIDEKGEELQRQFEVISKM